MKRKIVKHGPASLTVSLPMKWVKQVGIKAGDEIEITENNNSLTISCETEKLKTKRAKLNLNKFNKIMTNRFVSEFYRQGIEEILLTYDKKTFPNYKHNKEIQIEKHIKKLSERFIGMEIVSQLPGKIVLQCLIANDETKKLPVIEQRIYFLIKDMLTDFMDGMNGDFKQFHERVYDHHDLITRFSLYYLRLLNLSDIPVEQKSRRLQIISIIDKVIDKIRHTSEQVYVLNEKSNKTKKYLKLLFNLFIDHFDLILKPKYSLDDVNTFMKKRYALNTKIQSEKFTINELKVFTHCRIMLDIMNDFTETYATMHLNDYLEEY